MPRPGLFFSRLKLFLGHPLLLGVAAHITRGRAVWPDGMALTKVPHGRALHDDPCGLLHIGRQLFVGPVRAIEPTPRRASFHPHLNRRPQRLGKPSRLAWCPLNLQALYAPFVIVLEPEPHRGAMPPHILGNGRALAPPTRHQDRLTPVAEAPITGRLEGVFQLLLFRCRQPNPPHLCQPPLVRNFTRGYLRKDAMSSGACIRPRWCPAHSPQRTQDCCLPATEHRRLTTTLSISGLHHAAYLLATPGSVRPLTGRHAGSLLTCWLGFSQGGLAP
jgi:hypothetical protein